MVFQEAEAKGCWGIEEVVSQAQGKREGKQEKV